MDYTDDQLIEKHAKAMGYTPVQIQELCTKLTGKQRAVTVANLRAIEKAEAMDVTKEAVTSPPPKPVMNRKARRRQEALKR